MDLMLLLPCLMSHNKTPGTSSDLQQHHSAIRSRWQKFLNVFVT